MKRVKKAKPIVPAISMQNKLEKQISTLIMPEIEKTIKAIEKEYKKLEPKILAKPELGSGVEIKIKDSREKKEVPADILQELLEFRLALMDKNLANKAENVFQKAMEGFDNNIKLRLGQSLMTAQKGISIKFTISEAVQNILDSLIFEQTSLIKSIPAEFKKRIEVAVMQSVRNGRDAGAIVKDLEKIKDMSKRRIKNIARDQTNKATESITRTRCESMGITEGIWMHRGGSREPRTEHKKFNGQRFKLSEGLFDNTKHVKMNVKPGELPYCNCTFRPVIPDLE